MNARRIWQSPTGQACRSTVRQLPQVRRPPVQAENGAMWSPEAGPVVTARWLSRFRWAVAAGAALTLAIAPRSACSSPRAGWCCCSRRRWRATCGWGVGLRRGTEPSDRRLGGLILVRHRHPHRADGIDRRSVESLHHQLSGLHHAGGRHAERLVGMGGGRDVDGRLRSALHHAASRDGRSPCRARRDERRPQPPGRDGRGVRGRGAAHRQFRHAHPPGPGGSRAAPWPTRGARPRSRNGWRR